MIPVEKKEELEPLEIRGVLFNPLRENVWYHQIDSTMRFPGHVIIEKFPYAKGMNRWRCQIEYIHGTSNGRERSADAAYGQALNNLKRVHHQVTKSLEVLP